MSASYLSYIRNRRGYDGKRRTIGDTNERGNLIDADDDGDKEDEEQGSELFETRREGLQ